MFRSCFALLALTLLLASCGVEPQIAIAPTQTPYVLVVTATPARRNPTATPSKPTATSTPIVIQAEPSISLARLSLTEGEPLAITGLNWSPRASLDVVVGRAGTDGGVEVATVTTDDQGMFQTEVVIPGPEQGFANDPERMGIAVATRDRQQVAFAEFELYAALAVVPAPTDSPDPEPVPSPTQSLAAAVDPDNVQRYLQETYNTIGDHQLRPSEVSLLSVDEVDLTIHYSVSLDLDEYEIVNDLPKADLRKWAEQILVELEQRWPERDVTVSLSWDYYLDSIRLDSECHYMGEYYLDRGGWYHSQSVVEAHNFRSIRSRRVQVCGGK